MRIDVVTLFPEMIEQAVRFGVTARARERGLWQLGLWNPRPRLAAAFGEQRRPMSASSAYVPGNQELEQWKNDRL